MLRWLVSLTLFLIGLSTVVKAKEEAYQTGTDVLLSFVAQQINESEIKSYLGEDRYDHIIEKAQNWRVEDVQNVVKALMAIHTPPDTIVTILHIFTNEFVFSQNTQNDTKTASDVFFDFAIDNLTDLEGILNDEELTNLKAQTQNWTVEDAEKLLELMTAVEIAPDVIVKSVVAVIGFLQRPVDVIKDFAENAIGTDLEDVMGEDWLHRLGQYTHYWTAMGAYCFVDYLTEWIGAEKAAERIISYPSALWDIRCGAFKARVELYSRREYMGKERVKGKLERTLRGFHHGHPVNIEATIQKVEDIVGTENMQVFFEGDNPNIEAFNVVNTEIDEIVAFLKNTRKIPHNEVVKAILDNIEAFTKGKLAKIKGLVDQIQTQFKKYGIFDVESGQIKRLTDEDIFTKINQMILRNPGAFIGGHLANFTDLVHKMYNRLKAYGVLDKDEIKPLTTDEAIYARINTSISKSLFAFTRGNSANFTNIETEIQNRLEAYGLIDDRGQHKVLTDEDLHKIHAKINSSMLRNPQAFTRGRLANLTSIVQKIWERLKDYGILDDKGEQKHLTDPKIIQAMINNLILRNIEAFTRGNPANLTSLIKKIQERLTKYDILDDKGELKPLTDPKIIQAMINNLILKDTQAFTRGKLSNLTSLIQKIQERLAGYGILDNKGEQKHLTDPKIIQAMINSLIFRSPRALTRGSSANFTYIIAYLQSKGVSEVLINMAMLKNLAAFTQMNIYGLKALERRLGFNGLIEVLRTGKLDELLTDSSNGEATQQVAYPNPTSNVENRSTNPSPNCDPEKLLEQ